MFLKIITKKKSKLYALRTILESHFSSCEKVRWLDGRKRRVRGENKGL